MNWTKKCLDSNFVDPRLFGALQFLDPKPFWTQDVFGAPNFIDPIVCSTWSYLHWQTRYKCPGAICPGDKIKTPKQAAY